jgi:hypothetical protein
VSGVRAATLPSSYRAAKFDKSLLNERIGRYLCQLAHRLRPLPFEFSIQHAITPNASN